MYNITETAMELIEYYPLMSVDFLSESDYVKCVVQAIKKLYVDINHPNEYDRTLYTTDAEGVLFYDHDFDILQEEYILILARLKFKRMALSEVTGPRSVSYTTDALSVTGAKEGFRSIQQEIDDLENERRIVFHKMMAHESES